MSKKSNIQERDVTITVTQVDYLRLTNLIQNLRNNNQIDPEYLKFLNLELQKAAKIDSKAIAPDFITMNSVMTVKFLNIGTLKELRLVYPQQADFSKGLISVLSPLGCALLGYRTGDIVTFKAPIGEQKVKIENVIYQPEANGEDLI